MGKKSFRKELFGEKISFSCPFEDIISKLTAECVRIQEDRQLGPAEKVEALIRARDAAKSETASRKSQITNAKHAELRFKPHLPTVASRKRSVYETFVNHFDKNPYDEQDLRKFEAIINDSSYDEDPRPEFVAESEAY